MKQKEIFNLTSVLCTLVLGEKKNESVSLPFFMAGHRIDMNPLPYFSHAALLQSFRFVQIHKIKYVD